MKKNQSPKPRPKKQASKKKPASQTMDIDDFFDLDTAKAAPASGADFEMLGLFAKYPSAHRLALVSAIVFKGGKVNDAVKTALQIYDCCYAWLRDAAWERDFDHFGGEDDYLLAQAEYSFNEAVKEITCQKRLDRAIQYFSDYGMYSIAQDASFKTPEERLKRFEERMEFRKTEGFSAEEVIRLKHNFRNYFPKRRKKSIDIENSL